MKDVSPRQFSIRMLMALVLGLAPAFALARIDLFLGGMSAVYGGMLAIFVVAGSRAGRIGWPFSITCFVTVMLIMGWFAIRDGALEAGIGLTVPDFGRPPQWPFPITAQAYPHIRRLAAWEAWSLFRWWLLFGGLTWLVVARRAEGSGGSKSPAARWGDRPVNPEPNPSFAEASRRLLWFFPWLAVMEIGLLGGVWLLYGGFRIVPEPSTLMPAMLPGSGSDLPLMIYVNLFGLMYWIGRSAVPTLIVGTAFFRIVGHWRWRRSFVGALYLIPAAALLSSIWSGFYMILM